MGGLSVVHNASTGRDRSHSEGHTIRIGLREHAWSPAENTEPIGNGPGLKQNPWPPPRGPHKPQQRLAQQAHSLRSASGGGLGVFSLHIQR
jgi:hypothetical protein